MTVTVRHVQRVVAEHFDIPFAAMRELPRNVYAPENEARRVAMFFARELTGKSYQNIANLFGRHNHTTVFYARRKVRRTMAESRDFSARVETLKRAILSDAAVDNSQNPTFYAHSESA